MLADFVAQRSTIQIQAVDRLVEKSGCYGFHNGILENLPRCGIALD